MSEDLPPPGVCLRACRWGKGTCYEEDVKVPFFIRGPGIPAGQSLGYQASMVDVAPTLMALAGGQIPEDADGLPLPLRPLEQVGRGGQHDYHHALALLPLLGRVFQGSRGFRGVLSVVGQLPRLRTQRYCRFWCRIVACRQFNPVGRRSHLLLMFLPS